MDDRRYTEHGQARVERPELPGGAPQRAGQRVQPPSVQVYYRAVELDANPRSHDSSREGTRGRFIPSSRHFPRLFLLR